MNNLVTKERVILPESDYEFLEDNYEDTRFKKVKIFIAHTGENLNHTSFSRESLIGLSESLSYVPIVGYIKENDDYEEDFAGHEQRITIENNGITIDYMGVPFGFIPEQHNARMEVRDGKEWLVAEGYLWTKFRKSIDLFDKNEGKKSQSMEIENVVGSVDDEGVLHINEASFSALCILGNEVLPAMSGSTIEYFSKDNQTKKLIEDMLVEFSARGGKSVEKEEIKEFEEDVTEEIEEGVAEDKQEVTQDEAIEDPVSEEEVAEVLEDSSEDAEENEITEEEVQENSVEEIEESEDEVILESDKNYADDLDKANEKIAQLEEEVSALREYKANVERSEKVEMLESYSQDLSSNAVKSLKEVMDSMSVEEFEKEIAYRIFKNEKEQSSSTAKAFSYGISASEDSEEFSTLKQYL